MIKVLKTLAGVHTHTHTSSLVTIKYSIKKDSNIDLWK